MRKIEGKTEKPNSLVFIVCLVGCLLWGTPDCLSAAVPGCWCGAHRLYVLCQVCCWTLFNSLMKPLCFLPPTALAMPLSAAAAAWAWTTHNQVAPAVRHMVNYRRPPRAVPALPFPSGDGNDPHTELMQPHEHEEKSTASVEDLLAVGRRRTQADDLASATRQFQRAVDLAPRSAVCRAELGRALVRQGKRGDGFSSLVAAFEIDSLCPGVKDGFLEYYRAEIEVRHCCCFLHRCCCCCCCCCSCSCYLRVIAVRW